MMQWQVLLLLIVSDIRSDAMNTSDLEEDKKQLFQELLKR